MKPNHIRQQDAEIFLFVSAAVNITLQNINMITKNATNVTAFTFRQVTQSAEDKDRVVPVLNHAPCHERMEKWVHNYINSESQH